MPSGTGSWFSANRSGAAGLRYCESGVMPFIGWMEGQDNVLGRHSGLDQLVGDSTFRAIMLDPELSSPNVNVQDGPVYPLVLDPTRIGNFVVVLDFVKDRLNLDVAERRLVFGVLRQKPHQNCSIILYSNHETRVSSPGSKTTIWTPSSRRTARVAGNPKKDSNARLGTAMKRARSGSCLRSSDRYKAC